MSEGREGRRKRKKGEIKIRDRVEGATRARGWVRIARNLLVPVQVWKNEIVKFQSTLEALSTGEVLRVRFT